MNKVWFTIWYYVSEPLEEVAAVPKSFLRPRLWMFTCLLLTALYGKMENYRIALIFLVLTVAFYYWNRVRSGEHNKAYKEYLEATLWKRQIDK